MTGTERARRQSALDKLRDAGHCTCGDPGPKLTPVPREDWPADVTSNYIVEHEPGCLRAVVFTPMPNVRSVWLSGPHGLVVEVDL